MKNCKTEIQLQTNASFCGSILERFKTYCTSQDIEPTNENLVRYLIRCNLIQEMEINRFTVLQLYPKALYNHDGVKLRAIIYIEDHVPVQERTIWTIVNKMQRRFNPNNGPKFPEDLTRETT